MTRDSTARSVHATTLSWSGAIRLPGRTRGLSLPIDETRNAVACDETSIQWLRTLGFSDEAIFDIIETAAMYNFTNRIASATGMLPNREYHGMGRER